MKYRFWRIIFQRPVYNWVCRNMDAALMCLEADVPLDKRMRFARWLVHVSV